MRIAEIVDSIKSAEEFIELNKIVPREIIVVWDEDIDASSTSPAPKKKGCGKDLGYGCKCGNLGIGKERMYCEECKKDNKEDKA